MSKTLYHPKLPVPPPLRGAEEGSFAADTVKRRLPKIGRRVLEENSLTADMATAVQTILDSIPQEKIRPLANKTAPDTVDWQEYILPHLDQTWLEVPWFFAETYFYRRLIAAVDYFNSGLDPFAYQKEQGLHNQRQEVESLCQQLDRTLADGWQPEALRQLLLTALWGNQADMSLWSAGDSSQPSHQSHEAQTVHLIVDEFGATLSHLETLSWENGRIDFLNDNVGIELVGDLVLADYLLSSGRVQEIRFHLKLHPTFVSDATLLDLEQTVYWLVQAEAAPVTELGQRLRRALANGRLRLHTHPFWTSPLPMWEMPQTLRDLLAPAHLVLSKGDANYRRALGDAHWPYTTPFDEIVSYFPAPILFLRTCKSNVIAGLDPGQPGELDQQDSNWITNGKWGVFQFAPGKD